ncbi:gibberellin-regulated protein 10 [Selaginella moellendorffii]|uniref:gibberellin-regulated protein 10 n=1 Tax=Selaginella moellendorffii TaxID=88036 RepID=UPI000D1CB465|nr:gibberellin-regulated protein 10 [Selaginella moellendorffii]|eukprot:XP_002982920.2 gibberellin-regulated protein 10 [Selaginella moellendorffii]
MVQRYLNGAAFHRKAGWQWHGRQTIFRFNSTLTIQLASHGGGPELPRFFHRESPQVCFFVRERRSSSKMALALKWLASLVLLMFVIAENGNVVLGSRELTGYDCGGKCKYRCSNSWKPKMCNKMCNICCSKCFCVPNGPKASKKECPCYDAIRNDEGEPKCP